QRRFGGPIALVHEGHRRTRDEQRHDDRDAETDDQSGQEADQRAAAFARRDSGCAQPERAAHGRASVRPGSSGHRNYILSGAETPISASPLRSTWRAASNRARRARLVASSSTRNRSAL